MAIFILPVAVNANPSSTLCFRGLMWRTIRWKSPRKIWCWMLTVPGKALEDSLLTRYQATHPEAHGPIVVHRLDQETSGLVVFVKDKATHKALQQQFEQHTISKCYVALLDGLVVQDEGVIDRPIGRHPVDRKKMCVTPENSRNAVTHYNVLRQYGGYAHLRLKLETGRTHQIRVHMAYIGHPVLGDDVYGKPYKGLEGQCLHARKIGFIHTTTGEYMEFESELPEYFRAVLCKLEKM